MLCNAEDRCLSPTLPDFCPLLSHCPSPTSILTCGRNTQLFQFCYGRFPFVSGQSPSLPPAPHPHLLLKHGTCVVWLHTSDQSWGQERTGQERVSVWVTLLLVYLQLLVLFAAKAEMPELQGQMSAPSLHLQPSVILTSGPSTPLYQALMCLYMPHPTAAGNHYS